MNKPWYAHTTDYSSAMGRNDSLNMDGLWTYYNKKNTDESDRGICHSRPVKQTLAMGSRSGAFLGMGTWSRSDYLMDIDLSGWRDMNNFGARECGGCFVQHNEYTECLWITNLGKAKIEAIEYFMHFARIKRKMCLIAWVGKQRVLGETGGETVVGSCQASWGAQVLLTVKFCLLSCISRHSYFREYHRIV